MFPRVGRRDGDDGVPVVRRRDHHGVDIVAADQSTEIVIRRATLVGAAWGLSGVVVFNGLLRVLAAMGIDIAHSDGLRLFSAEEIAHQAAVLLAHANKTERDAVVGLHIGAPDA